MTIRLAKISAEAIADRLAIRPHTVTLEAVGAIYTQLSAGANADGHSDLSSHTNEAAATIQELIRSGQPRGLVDSARHIHDIDELLETAKELRDVTAAAYDRYDKHTCKATEAMEILLAYSALSEASDFYLRTGIRIL